MLWVGGLLLGALLAWPLGTRDPFFKSQEPMPEIPPPRLFNGDGRPSVDVCKMPYGLNWDQYFVPDSLRFIEPLAESLKPSDILILTGGDCKARRLYGFPKLTADSVFEFAAYHGYHLAFLDELDYDRQLIFEGTKFHVYWQRVFALPAARERFKDVKYIVWLDDDILIPYQETHMLNHYVNQMEADDNWEMTYAEEGFGYVLNSGLFIMKNRVFAHNVYGMAKIIGLENNGYLAHLFGHEQEAIIEVRKRYGLQHQIRVLPHRQGIYNINSFYRETIYDPPGSRWKEGDAFVHLLGSSGHLREQRILRLLHNVQDWRKSIPSHVKFPINLPM